MKRILLVLWLALLAVGLSQMIGSRPGSSGGGRSGSLLSADTGGGRVAPADGGGDILGERGTWPPEMPFGFWEDYKAGAHGDPETGVNRLPQYPTGHCLHCHDLRGGFSEYLLFQPYETDVEKRDLCLYCHDGVAAPAPPDTQEEHQESATTPCVNCHDHHIPTSHSGGGDCITCHGHDEGYEYAPGQFSQGRGSSHSHSTHTENDGDDLRGPFIDCDACHDTGNFPAFKSGAGDPPYDLSETDVCSNCHSSGGAYDGIEDPDVGARYGNGGEVGYNWGTGIYDGNGVLRPGMQSWCITCHDDVPAYSRPEPGGGVYAPNMAGDDATYGFYVTGHGRPASSGPYPRLSWQGASETGNPAADISSCTECHDGQPSEAHIDHDAGTTNRLRPGFQNDQDNTNCNNCHSSGGADPQFYTSSGAYENAAHGGRLCSDCHDVHGSTGTQEGMTRADDEGLCFQCHTEGVLQNDALANNRPGGYVSSDDIEQAFGMSEKHNLGTSFTLGGETYTLECVSCHNIHVVNGRYWDAEEGDRSPVTRFPGNLDGFPATEVWGDGPGEKMDDFAARGSGTGGWYYGVARGEYLSFDQPAVYQPPKSGNGWDWEFEGDVLPDYATMCLDCHSYRMSAANPPVNWGQGIDCTDNSVDPPDQRIECGAQHGLAPANKPYAWDPNSGMMGSSGNPDPIFSEPGVQRGRGAGQFMRWPYDSVHRNAGINFVMSCTDCHEAHGSNRGSIIRERFNVNANGDCGTGGNSNPDGENCTDGGNWNSYCNACHYYYGYQHAGMSCGNASCHEANSPHRIIHVTHSGDTNLWTEPSRPTTTPEIDNTDGAEGSNELVVTFEDSVWTNMDRTGALVAGDFLLTDVGGNNPRTITGVIHTPGGKVATLVMSAPLTAADIGQDLLATRGISIWKGADLPAGPWTVAIPNCPSEAVFQLNDPAGSPTTADESGIITGTVSDTAEVFPGDGFYHGDSLDNYIDFVDDTKCLNGARKLTLEFMVKPTVIDLDSDNPNRNNTSQTLFQRQASYLLRILRADWQANNMPDPGEASLIFKYKPVERYGGPAWKQAITDVDLYPLQRDHWYHILLTFDSDIVGDIPIDIYIDDLGVNGNDVGELWSGFPNATKLQEPDDDWRAREGDEIILSDRACRIGAKTGTYGYPYMGLMDWMSVKLSVDTAPLNGLMGPGGGRTTPQYPSLPRAYALYQNYPNPFNPSTTIRYDIPAGGGPVPVRLHVYDVRGRLVRSLVKEDRGAGRYEAHWDGRDDQGKPVPSGVYLYRTEAGRYVAVRKMVLAR